MTAGTPEPADWAAALDDFERRLAEYRSVLDDGTPAAGLWPPPGLTGGPIPSDLVDRARTLLAAAKELEGELVARRDELPAPRPTVRYRRRPALSTISTEL